MFALLRYCCTTGNWRVVFLATFRPIIVSENKAASASGWGGRVEGYSKGGKIFFSLFAFRGGGAPSSLATTSTSCFCKYHTMPAEHRCHNISVEQSQYCTFELHSRAGATAENCDQFLFFAKDRQQYFFLVEAHDSIFTPKKAGIY